MIRQQKTIRSRHILLVRTKAHKRTPRLATKGDEEMMRWSGEGTQAHCVFNWGHMHAEIGRCKAAVYALRVITARVIGSGPETISPARSRAYLAAAAALLQDVEGRKHCAGDVVTAAQEPV